MANLEQTPVIQFRTDDSGVMKTVSSVKELKTAISQLKDSIVEMRQSGQDTTKEVTQLQAAQRELNTVMGLTKKGVDGVEGSYDRLVAQLREAKQEWRALPQFIKGELNPEWEKAAQRCKDLNNQLKDMDEKVGVYSRNVGNYKSALEGFTGTLGQVNQVGGQMVNGFAALSNVLGIVGMDTESLNTSMNNLRIVCGILNGARGLLGLVNTTKILSKEQKKETASTTTNTAAKTANAAATTTMTFAEKAATVATQALGAAWKALGIGLIVAGLAFVVDHLEDIAEWIGGIAEKLGLVKKKSDDNLSAAEKTKKAYEKEKEELDKQVRVMQAKGQNQKDILKFQIQQIDASIATKEAELESAKATLERLKQHNWLQRVLKGEQKEYREIKKYIEEANAELEEMRKNRSNYKFDLELEGYKEATDAAKKGSEAAKKKAEEALKAANEVVKKGLEQANKAIQAEETELEKVNREFKEDVKLIQSAITAVKEQNIQTEKLSTLEEGLIARREQYYGKLYELKVAENYERINREAKDLYSGAKDYENALKQILGYSDSMLLKGGAMNAQEAERLAILKEEKRIAEEGLPPVAFTGGENPLEALVEEWKKTKPEDLVKEFGEPTATAILEYIKKNDELKDAGIAIYSRIFASFEDAIDNAASGGKVRGAEWLLTIFEQDYYKKMKELGIGKETLKYFTDLQRKVYEAMMDSPLPAGFDRMRGYFITLDTQILQMESDAADLSRALTQVKEANAGLYDEEGNLIDRSEASINALNEESRLIVELAALEEKIYLERFNRFSAHWKNIQKAIEVYGQTSANVVNNTADLWNTLIDIRQKDIDKQKDQGKISEKEWNKQTERNKKSFEGVKALQIGTAVVNTAAAIVQALADTTVPSYYVKAANAVAAGIAGAAEIAKIASTEYGTQPATPQAPQITQAPQIVNSYGLNAQDYADAAAANPVKVYVLESDITEAQNTSKVRVEESTF